MEQIIVYHKSDLETPITVLREEFYTHRAGKYAEYFITVVDGFIFTPEGKMILQRRAANKKVAPNKLHTTVGGHINAGEDASFALSHECMEELGYACTIVPDGMPFGDAYETMKPYTDRVVLMQLIKRWTIEFVHQDAHETYLSRDFCNDFVGVFSGIPQNLDDSVSEFLTFSLEELDQEIATDAEDFTRSFLMHYA